jgi:hypothetical protein
MRVKKMINAAGGWSFRWHVCLLPGVLRPPPQQHAAKVLLQMCLLC